MLRYLIPVMALAAILVGVQAAYSQEPTPTPTPCPYGTDPVWNGAEWTCEGLDRDPPSPNDGESDDDGQNDSDGPGDNDDDDGLKSEGTSREPPLFQASGARFRTFPDAR